VLIDSTTEFSRRFLTGLIQYANENGPWIFYRLPSYYKALYGEAGIVERIKEWGIDVYISVKVPHISIEKYTTYKLERNNFVHKE
jgi:LacI family transcriptional regulator